MGSSVEIAINTNNVRCLNISIFDDKIVENEELFGVKLESIADHHSFSVVTNLSIAAISILDNDGELLLLS